MSQLNNSDKKLETAKKIAAASDADLVEIRPVKAYPDKGIRKFFLGGKSAVMSETPALQPYNFRAEDYGRIIIGFPVWASNMAPPVRTFVQENRESLRDRSIAIGAGHIATRSRVRETTVSGTRLANTRNTSCVRTAACRLTTTRRWPMPRIRHQLRGRQTRKRLIRPHSSRYGCSP